MQVSTFLPALTLATAGLFASTASLAAWIIDPGKDYLHTEFAQFDFSPATGGAIGVIEFEGNITGPGDSDTVLVRSAPVINTAMVAGPADEPLIDPDFQIAELSLISVDEVDTVGIGGAGLERIFTANVMDQGSQLDVSFTDATHGTFTSMLMFKFDLYGEISGLLSSGISVGTLNQGAADWNTDFSILYPGESPANWGVGFYTAPAVHEDLLIHHRTRSAIPSPSVLILMLAAAGALPIMRRAETRARSQA